MNEGNLQDIISGKKKIGVDISVNMESALILGATIIGAVIIGSILSKMLSEVFGLK